jgi:hypothetical protein
MKSVEWLISLAFAGSALSGCGTPSYNQGSESKGVHDALAGDKTLNFTCKNIQTVEGNGTDSPLSMPLQMDIKKDRAGQVLEVHWNRMKIGLGDAEYKRIFKAESLKYQPKVGAGLKKVPANTTFGYEFREDRDGDYLDTPARITSVFNFQTTLISEDRTVKDGARGLVLDHVQVTGKTVNAFYSGTGVYDCQQTGVDDKPLK